MSRSFMLSWLAWVALMLPTGLLAQEAVRDGLRITHAVAAPTPPGAPNGAAYLSISAGGALATLVDAHTPVSDDVELHMTTMKDGAMHMRPLETLDIAPGETVTMHPGDGVHLMLFGLNGPLKEGMTFPLMLDFRGLDNFQVEVRVSHPRINGQEAASNQPSH